MSCSSPNQSWRGILVSPMLICIAISVNLEHKLSPCGKTREEIIMSWWYESALAPSYFDRHWAVDTIVHLYDVVNTTLLLLINFELHLTLFSNWWKSKPCSEQARSSKRLLARKARSAIVRFRALCHLSCVFWDLHSLPIHDTKIQTYGHSCRQASR